MFDNVDHLLGPLPVVPEGGYGGRCGERGGPIRAVGELEEKEQP